MISQPVRGMRDFSPKETALRDYLLNIITLTAENHGFHHIETPAIEHLTNLTSGVGGENESLIFKIMKRGADLSHSLDDFKEHPDSTPDLSDSGLRYDLTVPLSRYYSAYSNNLPSPFKSLQIAPVWRADRPQKGRFRQFVQADMDILGDSSPLAEIDVLTTVLDALNQILSSAGITNLTLRINDRRLLESSAKSAGFNSDDLGPLLISLDKLDKIGMSGVREDLIAHNLDSTKVDHFLSLFDDKPSLSSFTSNLPDLDPTIVKNLNTIMTNVGDTPVLFDPSLVRGMSYYTGPIFECSAGTLSSSVAGGGRYDRMIGKFTGTDVPACGFSIGFERIMTILEEANFTPPSAKAKTAFLLSPDLSTEQLNSTLQKANDLRKEGKTVTTLPLRRNADHQISTLKDLGYTDFEKIF